MKQHFDSGPSDGRITPTEEDLVILRRSIRRIMEWDAKEQATKPDRGERLLRAMRLACGDMLHFKPKEENHG